MSPWQVALLAFKVARKLRPFAVELLNILAKARNEQEAAWEVRERAHERLTEGALRSMGRL